MVTYPFLVRQRQQQSLNRHSRDTFIEMMSGLFQRREWRSWAELNRL